MGPARSAWDRLQEEWSALAGALPSRTAPYDELLARPGGLTPGADGYPAARLAREHARRVEYWRHRLEHAPARAASAESASGRRRRIEGVFLVAGGLAAVILIALAWRSSWPAALAAGAGLAGALVLVAVTLRRSERPRLGEALHRARCPDCGYDLAGLPPALPPEALAGQRVGPAACPECGGAWPCVPPPAPIANDAHNAL